MHSADSGASSEAVGKSTMDAEHELLHGLLEELQAELLAGGPGVEELTVRLDDVARAHFLEEQSLMRLHAYPAYEAHQNEHDRLIEELRELTGEVRDGGASDAVRLVEKLDLWFNVHMRTTDAALEEYLRQHGIRSRGTVERPGRPDSES